MTAEQVRQALSDAIEALRRHGRCGSFIEALGAFDAAFRQAAKNQGLNYSENDGINRNCLFFYPFTPNSNEWRYSVEVLDTNGHYLIFDRAGSYAIYEKSGSLFGKLILANPADGRIGQLEACAASDLISTFVNTTMQNRQMNENNIFHLQHLALIKGRPTVRLKKLLTSMRNLFLASNSDQESE